MLDCGCNAHDVVHVRMEKALLDQWTKPVQRGTFQGVLATLPSLVWQNWECIWHRSRLKFADQYTDDTASLDSAEHNLPAIKKQNFLSIDCVQKKILLCIGSGDILCAFSFAG